MATVEATAEEVAEEAAMGVDLAAGVVTVAKHWNSKLVTRPLQMLY